MRIILSFCLVLFTCTLFAQLHCNLVDDFGWHFYQIDTTEKNITRTQLVTKFGYVVEGNVLFLESSVCLNSDESVISKRLMNEYHFKTEHIQIKLKELANREMKRFILLDGEMTIENYKHRLVFHREEFDIRYDKMIKSFFKMLESYLLLYDEEDSKLEELIESFEEEVDVKLACIDSFKPVGISRDLK